MKNSTVENNPLLECSACEIELKPGEGKVSIDQTILCTKCKKEEEDNELTKEGEEGDFLAPEELESVYQSFAESQGNERLDSLEDN